MRSTAFATGAFGAPQRSFDDSMQLAANSMCTIGYGNLIPDTAGGRAALLLFALFGIGAGRLPRCCQGGKSSQESKRWVPAKHVRRCRAM